MIVHYFYFCLQTRSEELGRREREIAYQASLYQQYNQGRTQKGLTFHHMILFKLLENHQIFQDAFWDHSESDAEREEQLASLKSEQHQLLLMLRTERQTNSSLTEQVSKLQSQLQAHQQQQQQAPQRNLSSSSLASDAPLSSRRSRTPLSSEDLSAHPHAWSSQESILQVSSNQTIFPTDS